MKLQPKDQVLLEQAYQSIQEGGMPPTAGAAAHAGANPGVVNDKGQPLSEPEMKEAMAILDAYAKKIIDAQEAAAKFKDLYQRSGPDAAAHMAQVSSMSKVSPYNK